MGLLRPLFLVFAIITLTAGDGVAAADQKINIDKAGVAISGYDPVAYFEDGKPVKGIPAHQAMHGGATYHFASAAHLALFKANPEKYIPAYGGYCSYGMRYGQTSRIDPLSWKIVEGRLFLLYDQGTRELWQKQEADNISVADKVWRKLFGSN